MVKGVRVIVIILLAAAVVGCSRYIESRDPVRSLPDAGSVPVNLTACLDNGSVTIGWEVADSADIARFRVYVADSTGIDYTPWDSTTGFSITLEGLNINQRYFLKVATIANSGLESELSEAVSARVMYLSIMIQSDREYTNSRDVQVRISSPPEETSHLMLSEDSTFANAVFVSFVSMETSFRFSEGDGVKTVYARLQFFDGTQSGELLSDDIVLDTRARIDSVFFTPSGITFSAGGTIIFGLSTGETGGEANVAFTGVEAVSLYDDGTNGDLNAGDGIYSGYWVVPPSFTLNNGDVTGSFTDAAGNGAVQITGQEPLNIFSPPLPVTMLAVAVSTFEIDLSWTTSVSDNFSAYCLYRSTSPSVSETSDLVISIQDVNVTSFTDTTLDDNTIYYYRTYAYDNSGLSSGSNVDSAKTFENDTPEAVELAAVLRFGADTTAELTWTTSNEHDFASYSILRSVSGSAYEGIALLNDRNTTSYIAYLPSSPTVSITVSFKLLVFDKHGSFEESNEVNVVRPPSPPPP